MAAISTLSAMIVLAWGALGCGAPDVDFSGPVADWPEVGRGKGGLKFSPLDQITPENVGDLEVAWIHHHGDVSDGSGETRRTAFQTTPIVVGDQLYFCTGFNRVFALDPETGEERWSFDPVLRARGGEGPYPLTCRGVAYWGGDRDGVARGTEETGAGGASAAVDVDRAAADSASAGSATAGGAEAACATRILTGTRDSELIALDARTGLLCQGFGQGGRVALREGIGPAPPWEYYPTSAPIVVGDVVVIGALVADNLRTDAPSGVVRAFDVRTGALRWAWDPVPPDWPHRDAAGAPIYTAGTPNVWAPIAADEERGLVFVPTGNPSPDTYGGERNGIDYYGSSVVALDAATGEVVWSFQTVHHDVWDYDVASQPVLFELEGVGGGRPGVAQVTKMGHLFLLDRETGEPLYPVEERPVPQAGAVPGETLSPTQPFPLHPPPLHPATLTPEDAWGFTPIDRADCREIIAGYRSDGIFTPPSLEGSIQYPGSAGGANWGGAAIDPGRKLLFVNQSRMPLVATLVPRDEMEVLDPDSVVYPDEVYPQIGVPYGVKRGPLLSSFGAPCIPPPWGTLTAVDLERGEIVWESTLGTTRDQAPWPLWFDNGSPNLGGAIATASGLVFVGATTDKFIRAFSSETGEEVWRARLPYTANSTPITYRLGPDRRQYLVVPAGGHGWSEPGDATIAFALPE
jgi:quinoprotein glucose dehydrogenase